MEASIERLLSDVRGSRVRVLGLVDGLTTDEGARKPSESAWSVQDVLEHLVLAERGGYDLIRTAADRFRRDDPVWTGKSENDGLAIEAIIERTWKPKEDAPNSATPTGAWSVGIWSAHLASCDALLSDLPRVLEGLPLGEVIYPHFLCGPLNAVQRLEFLRYHMDRHATQIERLLATAC